MFNVGHPEPASTIDLAAFMQRETAFRVHVPYRAASPSAAGARQAAGGEAPADAYERGLAEGQALAEISHAVERQALLDLLKSAEALHSAPCPQLGHLMAAAVEHLVEQIVGNQPIDQAWLHGRIAEASAVIADADRDRVLHLNPADAALIGDGDIGMPLVSDPQIARGTLRIAAGEGWIEHGRPVYLDALRRALGTGSAGA
jgi:flagellar assembly protein FliH